MVYSTLRHKILSFQAFVFHDNIIPILMIIFSRRLRLRMMFSNMFSQLLRPAEALLTKAARKRLPNRMGDHMSGQSVRSPEFLVTNLALMIFLLGVNYKVFGQIVSLLETLIANVAHIRLLSCMFPHMTFQVTAFDKRTVTCATGELSFWGCFHLY